MTKHEEFRELVEVYALGVLDGEERSRLESHLASGCVECENALLEARRVVSELAFALPPVAPPPFVRERLLARAREKEEGSTEPGARRIPGLPVWTWLAAAACLVVAFGLGARVKSLQERFTNERAARQAAETELSRIQAYFNSVTGPRTHPVALKGLGPTPGAEARAFLDLERGRLFLYVYNLPSPPPGRTYQLWLIVGKNAPLSAGVFGVQPNGIGRLDGEPFSPFEGEVTVAVTEEPAGGVPQPTGPTVLLGS